MDVLLLRIWLDYLIFSPSNTVGSIHDVEQLCLKAGWTPLFSVALQASCLATPEVAPLCCFALFSELWRCRFQQIWVVMPWQLLARTSGDILLQLPRFTFLLQLGLLHNIGSSLCSFKATIIWTRQLLRNLISLSGLMLALYAQVRAHAKRVLVDGVILDALVYHLPLVPAYTVNLALAWGS